MVSRMSSSARNRVTARFDRETIPSLSPFPPRGRPKRTVPCSAQGNDPRRLRKEVPCDRADERKKLRKGSDKAVKSLARVTLCAGWKSRELRRLANKCRLGDTDC